jgi:spore protease
MNTGIESTKYILAIVKDLRPDLAIVIDSLAARNIDRLASTVQISNFGLSPGSGIGRMRQRIDRETLGIPVISVGIPTVANLSSVISDIMKETANLNKGKNYFITPKEIELVIKSGAILLSEAINDVFWSN